MEISPLKIKTVLRPLPWYGFNSVMKFNTQGPVVNLMKFKAKFSDGVSINLEIFLQRSCLDQ